MSKQFVLDCSVAVYWFVKNGPEADIAYAKKVEQSLLTCSAVVPSLWQLEIINVLLTYERKQQITLAAASAVLSTLDTLPIEVDHEVKRDILHLGMELNLSAYDACYLALALKKGLPLATLDKALLKAASTIGVELYL